ncbi:hypothetical protein CYFUS_006406 [Cystobacter fuscus]|uniref:Tetratricopeptide repeat domain protein n=1 Tax=Cystobacter fuscus TaxID=43 RepID=A0A250JAJ7_9BACT|nr:hypothetical protein [Cystobacter fuscus]ATB40944.1 hypothetical protein CYFUS_006406 [Cystobacter fuscus]
MTKTPSHPSVEELAERLRAARRAGAPGEAERLRLHRELAESCPSFTPNLLELARQLQLADEPGRDATEAFAEVRRLLEQAVVGSERSAPAVVEMGYFLDTIHHDSERATKLYEEGATRALETLEDAWAGLLRAWVLERTHESLQKALKLGELARKLLPDSGRIQGGVSDARLAAEREGLLKP